MVFRPRMPGPFVITTSCGSDPAQRNRTVSPDLMLSDFGPNEVCGPTLTLFVAARAGTAMAAATAATTTSSAMRRFMRDKPPGFGGRGGLLKTPHDAASFPVDDGPVRQMTFGAQKTGV